MNRNNRIYARKPVEYRENVGICNMSLVGPTGSKDGELRFYRIPEEGRAYR